MVSTFGNNIIGAYTGGVAVNEIYCYGTKVWPDESKPVPYGSYYFSWCWTPSSIISIYSSQTFTIEGMEYKYTDFPNRSFSWNTGVITEGAFAMQSMMREFTTNAIEVDYGAFIQSNATGTNYWLASMFFPNCKKLDRAFYEAWGVYYVSLPVCEDLGSYGAFWNCRWLSTINLPMVKIIPNETFWCCRRLHSAYLSICSYIGNDAFYSCSILDLWLYSNSVVQCHSSAFSKTSLSTIHVPRSLYRSYITDNFWDSYSSRIDYF